MLMINSNIGVFNNPGNANLRQIIRSSQVSNSSEILSMHILPVSFRKIHS